MKTPKILTGLAELDRIIGGLRRGQLIIIGARPGMGKTALALGISTHVVSRAKNVAAIFSLEMAKDEIGIRLLSQISDVPTRSIHKGRLRDSDWKSLSGGANALQRSRLFIDDAPDLTADDLAGKCLRLKKNEGRLDLVVIDYIQLMRGGERSARKRNQEIAGIIPELKNTAKELDCPILVLSQLSRRVESRRNKRPKLSDLKDAALSEKDVDLVMFIYRDQLYSKDSAQVGFAEVIVAKNCNGGIGTARLRYISDKYRFVSSD